MSDDPKEAPMRPCPHCGATDIVRDIEVQKSAEAGWVGLDYKALGPLRGTVCRFHVKNPQRKW